MRILILGGSGMLGHALLQTLAPRHDVRATLHYPFAHYCQWPLFHADNSFDNVDVRAPDALARTFGQFQPQAVVNCVGVVKQRHDADVGSVAFIDDAYTRPGRTIDSLGEADYGACLTIVR